MKEQIKEMANDIAKICPDLVENSCGQINCVTHLTLSLYKEGYRKQRVGEWEIRDEGIYPKCSMCGKYNHFRTDYCPHCGAKMKGATDERAD